MTQKQQPTHRAMVGMTLSVYANQAMRDAVVLSAVGNQALIEYVMPEGRTFLRILDLDEQGMLDPDIARSVSYNAIPAKFLADMRTNRAAVKPLLRAGFDEEVVEDRKWPRPAERERLTQRAQALAAKILGEEAYQPKTGQQ